MTLLKLLDNVSINGMTLYGDTESNGKSFVLGTILSIVKSLPNFEQIANMNDDEMQLSYGYGQSKLVDSSGASVTGTFETTNEFGIGCAPGLVAFINNSIAAEVNIGVLGFNYTHTKQVTDQVYVGYRKASQMNFKINIFSIALGIAFYL